MASGNGLVICLPESFGRELTLLINERVKQYNQEESPTIMAAAAEIALRDAMFGLPELVRSIEQFYRRAEHGYLLLRGMFEVGELPHTPDDDTAPHFESWRSAAAILMGILQLSAHRCGSYLDESGGRLAHMVMPARNSEQSYARSTKALSFHTEVVNGYFLEEMDLRPFGAASPEVFGLVCQRNSHGVATTALSLDALLRRLPYETVQTLMQPIYRTHSQSSFDRDIVADKVPVLTRLNNGQLGIRYSHSKLHAVDAQGEVALALLREALLAPADIERLVLEPGDLVLFNNRRCLHGRDPVRETARFDGKDRWLIRMYGFSHALWSLVNKSPDRHHVIVVPP
ncbi:TauD/TfdA family dioxygenase [Archangium sp.]|uniref:TauD/TfdA family dioxygenase n=1 Tax=Archangium sp. TaxID=1872627 RepID=UPI002D5F7967|nr:TauD/TfdA family dioxygenase [Archangium sp.]HYO54444.1 TauD/TfdA family dioxygenase [Archangium sp.]